MAELLVLTGMEHGDQGDRECDPADPGQRRQAVCVHHGAPGTGHQ